MSKKLRLLSFVMMILILISLAIMNKFSDNADMLYEDWYAVDNEAQADLLNGKYTGVQLEHKLKEVYRTNK